MPPFSLPDSFYLWFLYCIVEWSSYCFILFHKLLTSLSSFYCLPALPGQLASGEQQKVVTYLDQKVYLLKV